MQSTQKIKKGAIEDYISNSAATALLGKLSTGGYTGTAQDLRNEIASILANVRFLGDVTTTTVISGEVGNIYTIVGPGTYPNWGGMVVPDNNQGTLQRVNGAFSVSLVPITLVGAVSNSDLKYDGYVNKFDKSDNSVGGQTYQNQGINNLGVIGTNTGWVGAKIPVKESTQYSFKHSDAEYTVGAVGKLAYLNSAGMILSSIDMSSLPSALGLGGKTLTTPAGTAYIYKNVKVLTKDYLDTFQLQLGDTTTSYESYIKYISTIKGTKIIDDDGRKLIKGNTTSIANLWSYSYRLDAKIEGTKNWSTIAKANSINPTKIQLAFAFDLDGLVFTTGTLYNFNAILVSNDTNLLPIVQIRTFQGPNPSALDVGGTVQTSPETVGNFTIPSAKLFVNRALAAGTRYLKIYIECSLNIPTQLTSLRLDDIHIVIAGTKLYPINWGIYGINAGETIVYKQKLSDDLAKASDIPSIDGFQNNYLKGKKMVTIGDSMVKGHTLSAGLVWDALIANRNGMTRVNYGINGVQLTNDNGFGLSVLNRYSLMDNDADYIGVFALTNDAAAGVAIGVDADSFAAGQLTVKGALNDLCVGLINKYPNKKIYFITPYNRNVVTQPYITAMITIAKKYSIPVFDNWTNGGVCWSNTTQVASITLGDGYHLNVEGMIYASLKYEAFLRTL